MLLIYRGKITYYTQPPEQHTLPTHLSAEIVTTMSAGFDVGALTGEETGDIKGKSLLHRYLCRYHFTIFTSIVILL